MEHRQESDGDRQGGAGQALALDHVALLSREQLVARWRHGSDAFFWRAEARGLLIPCRQGRSVGYSWRDVFAFEGGEPLVGMEDAYRCDLLLPGEVARLCPWSAATIVAKARAGALPVRRVGRVCRFVGAEVARWLKGWSPAGDAGRVNGESHAMSALPTT